MVMFSWKINYACLLLFVLALQTPGQASAQSDSMSFDGDVRATGYITSEKNLNTTSVLIGPKQGTRLNAIGLANSLLDSDYNFASGVSDTNLYINRPSGRSILFRENDSDQVAIYPGGKLGVGTSSPTAYKLHVIGDALISDGVGPDTGLYINPVGMTSGMTAIDFRNLGYGRPYNFRVNAINTMFLSTLGYVGIGTTNPVSKLDVSGSTATTIRVGSNINITPGANFGQLDFIHLSSTYPESVQPFGRIAGTRPSSNGTADMTFAVRGWGTGALKEAMRISNLGNVGIGTATPSRPLEVNGAFRLDDTSTPTLPASNGTELYSCAGSVPNDSQLIVCDATGQRTRLNSHADPAKVDPAASSSFNDPNIELPFSFYHENTFIGKGQIVDMAKLVAYVEKQMQAEKGQKNGRLVYTYQLPASECTTVAQYNKTQQLRQAEYILRKLDQLPWIKVPVGVDGTIPDEAFKAVPEFITVVKRVRVVRKEIDCSAKKLVSVESFEDRQVQEPTGKTKLELREDWKLENGELYRRPSIKDINIDSLVHDVPQLPKWILDRIKMGQQTSMSIQQLSNEIREILTATKENTSSMEATRLAN